MRNCYQSAAHFIEIDLLRSGRPMPLENRPKCEYSVLVSRAEARSWGRVLVDPGPAHPPRRLSRFPCSQADPEARIDLQGDPRSGLRHSRLPGLHLREPARTAALLQRCSLGKDVRSAGLRVRLGPLCCCGGTRRWYIPGVRSRARRPGEESLAGSDADRQVVV